MALTDILRSAVLGVFLSCAGPTLATRPYTSAANPQESAYLNMRDILIDLCCQSLTDSYPKCKHFEIDQRGFSCEQLLFGQGMNPTAFTWGEIQDVQCRGNRLNISGEYNNDFIAAKTDRQCQDLAGAMRKYLRLE